MIKWLNRITTLAIFLFPLMLISTLLILLVGVVIFGKGNESLPLWLQTWIMIGFYSAFFGGGLKGALLFISVLINKEADILW